jgi:hypothetical protein
VRLILGFILVASAPAQVWEKPIVPGVTYRMEVDAATPRLIHALRFTPGAPGLDLSPELAGGTINETGTVKGRLSPSKIAQAAKAIAVMNADFFSFDHGAPIGLMVRKGELITSPLRTRCVFAWGRDYAFALPTFRASLADESGVTLSLDAVNQPTGNHQVCLYTPVAGDISIPNESLVALVRAGASLPPNGTLDVVVDRLMADARRMTLAPGEMLLVARGNRLQALSALRPGHKARIRVETSGVDWGSCENAIGGGPFLLKDGKPSIDAAAQGFNAAFSESRHPRTAIGRTRDGDLWLVAIDGRQSMSAGATLAETAEVMRRLGCVSAMNLDGGGSTNLHVLGVTVNRPSDKSERPVSNALALIATELPQAPLAEGRSVELPAGLAPLQTAAARVLQAGQPVPNRSGLWSAMGAAWVDQGGLVRALDPGKATVTVSVAGLVLEVQVLVKASEAKGAKGSKG